MSVAKQSSAFLLRLLMFAIVGETGGATLAADESNSKDVSLKYWMSFRNGTPILSGKTCHLDRKCTIYQDADNLDRNRMRRLIAKRNAFSTI